MVLIKGIVKQLVKWGSFWGLYVHSTTTIIRFGVHDLHTSLQDQLSFILQLKSWEAIDLFVEVSKIGKWEVSIYLYGERYGMYLYAPKNGLFRWSTGRPGSKEAIYDLSQKLYTVLKSLLIENSDKI